MRYSGSTGSVLGKLPPKYLIEHTIKEPILYSRSSSDSRVRDRLVISGYCSNPWLRLPILVKELPEYINGCAMF